jgi:hypothetical protein
MWRHTVGAPTTLRANGDDGDRASRVCDPQCVENRPSSPPPAAGVRIDWRDVPLAVRQAIEERLGSPVVDAVSQLMGFSPALAARVRAASGVRAFVKAVPADLNPDSPNIYRREAEIVSQLPTSLPVPRFLWWLDQGPEGWVILAFEDIEGRHPRQPWDERELAAVLGAVDELAWSLTPSPISAPAAGELIGSWQGWRQLAEEPPPTVSPWVRHHLDRLVELEAAAPAAVEGQTLLHLDVRSDNVLLTEDRVYIVDWPWASIGAPWVEPLCFAPSVEMQGGPSAPEVFGRSKAAAGADRDAVAAALAAVGGMLVHHGGLPPPPGLPTLRGFQAAQGEVAIRWLQELLDRRHRGP